VQDEDRGIARGRAAAQVGEKAQPVARAGEVGGEEEEVGRGAAVGERQGLGRAERLDRRAHEPGEPLGPGRGLGGGAGDEGQPGGGREALRRLGEAQFLDRDAAAVERVLGLARAEDAAHPRHERDLVTGLTRNSSAPASSAAMRAASSPVSVRRITGRRASAGSARIARRSATPPARKPFVGDDEVGPVAPRLVQHLGRRGRRPHVVARLDSRARSRIRLPEDVSAIRMRPDIWGPLEFCAKSSRPVESSPRLVKKAFGSRRGRRDAAGNAAETVGLRALGWLAANEELLPVFLGSTGRASTTCGRARGIRPSSARCSISC
jgi:hypothetical protein